MLLERIKMRRNFIKSIFILLLSLSLFGCNDQSASLKDLQNKVGDLTYENQFLQNKIDQLELIDYKATYKLTGGAYFCQQQQEKEIQEIRFLSNKLIHITGRNIYDDVMFDNYYVVENPSNNHYIITEEVIVNQNRGMYTFESMIAGGYLINFELSDDLKTLSYSPFKSYDTCTYVSDLKPINGLN